MLYQSFNTDSSLDLFVSLKDGSGNLLSSTSGALNVYFAGTTGAVAPGTAATSSMLTGAVYNSAGITLTNGQQAALQMDSAGRLLVDIGAPTNLAINLAQVGGVAIALGQTTMSASLPVTFASNQSALSTTFNALGSVTGATAATQSVLTGGIYNSTLPTLTTGQQAGLQLDASGRLIVDLGASTATVATNVTQIGGSALALGQTTMAASIPVVLASNQAAIPVTANVQTTATATLTNVTPTTTSASLVASNTGRKGLMIFNQSGLPVYLAYGATAATTAFTVLIAPNSLWEIENSCIYTGQISCILASGTATGKLFVTELS